MLLSITLTIAMVNTEKLRLNLDDSGFSGDIELSFDIQTGNTEFAKLELEPNLVWRTGNNLVFWLNDMSRLWKSSDDFINKGYTHLRYNYDFSSYFSLEVLTQAEFNYARNLDARYLVGAGVRFLPMKKDYLILAVGLTGLQEREEMTGGDITDIPRGSSYINFSIWKDDNITFANTVYFQPSIEDFEDYRIMDEAEITVKLFGDLSFTTSATYFYDSQPPEGIKKYDFSLENGLEYSF